MHCDFEDTATFFDKKRIQWERAQYELCPFCSGCRHHPQSYPHCELYDIAQNVDMNGHCEFRYPHCQLSLNSQCPRDCESIHDEVREVVLLLNSLHYRVDLANEIVNPITPYHFLAVCAQLDIQSYTSFLTDDRVHGWMQPRRSMFECPSMG